MTIFALIVLAVISFISSRCFFIERWRRKKWPAPPPKSNEIAQYEEFEKIVLEMIEATAISRAEIQDRMHQFYQDHPPPYPRDADLKRVITTGKTTRRRRV